MGAGGSPAPLHAVSHASLYRDQLGLTQEALKGAQKEIDSLAEGLRCSETAVEDDPRAEKLAFLEAQRTVGVAILKKLLCQAAQYDMQACEDQDDAHWSSRETFYVLALRLLTQIEVACNRACRLEAVAFRHVIQAFDNSLAVLLEHPALVAAGLASSAAVGGLVGAMASPLLVSCVAGAVVGLVASLLLLAGICLIRWVQAQQPKDRVAQARKEFEAALENLQEASLSPADMDELCHLYQKHFVEVMTAALRSTSCTICFEDFPASGGLEGEWPCKTARCTCSNLLCHRRCLENWQRASGRDTCFVCEH